MGGGKMEFDDGDILKCGGKGTLVTVHDLSGPAVRQVEYVDLELEEGATHKVPFHSLSLCPPPPDLLDELSTGLQLPLRGAQVQQIWEAATSYEADSQTQLVVSLLDLEMALP